VLKIKNTLLKDACILSNFASLDNRGSFVKVFNQDSCIALGIDFTIRECFYSVSHKHVIRGMHYHAYPKGHSKIIYCTQGSILDVILDIRPDSDTFGQYSTNTLTATDNLAIYISVGFAHGFLALEDNSVVEYLQNGTYSAEHDSGILWNSFGMDWGVANPITSPRDNSFITWQDYKQKQITACIHNLYC
jgi:dTDP-4-dehydrorhamnose 3,5-epimerase